MNERFQINEKIGDYRILGFIGQGGMGEVYHAIHEKLNRQVAVKVLGSNANLDQNYKARFLNEARVQASLHHPNIAALYDFQEVGNELLIFMEFVDGESLDSLIERSYFSVEESLKVFELIVTAIVYVHANGIIHRDIKTENVKLTADGTPKLLDFGIAKDQQSRTLTQVGGVIGTPNYLAPEQLEGKPATEQTDIWSLGVLLYKMLTGGFPFESEIFEGLIYQITQAQFSAPETVNPIIPKVVSSIIKKCLTKDLSYRYQKTSDLLQDVRQVLNERYGYETFLTKTTVQNSFPITKVLAMGGGVFLFLFVIFIGIWAIGGSDETSVNNGKSPVKTAENLNKNVSVAKNTEPPIAQTEKKNPKIGNKTIRIETIGGSAEVWRNGQKIGNTPFDVEVGEGEVLNLKLKRQGYLDQDINPEVTSGKKIYTYSLEAK